MRSWVTGIQILFTDKNHFSRHAKNRNEGVYIKISGHWFIELFNGAKATALPDDHLRRKRDIYSSSVDAERDYFRCYFSFNPLIIKVIWIFVF